MKAEDTAKIVFMRATGESFDSISKQLKLSKQTVFDCCKSNRNSIYGQRAEIVENILAGEKQIFTARIESLCKLASKLKAEIESRDLKQVSTDTLCKLYFSTLKNFSEQSTISYKYSDIERVLQLDGYELDGYELDGYDYEYRESED